MSARSVDRWPPFGAAGPAGSGEPAAREGPAEGVLVPVAGSFPQALSRRPSPVGTAGFEPATPGPPDQCANQAAPRPGASDHTQPPALLRGFTAFARDGPTCRVRPERSPTPLPKLS
jgi:hypothetical protein